MNKTYTYEAFGLILSSEIECKELLIGKGNPDVVITLESSPNRYQSELKYKKHVIKPNGDFYFHVPNVAEFFVSRGSTVLISLCTNTNMGEVRMYLLGTIMSIILFQRKLIPFHCGCIKTPKGAVLITADSGVGKSSLIGSFYKKGYSILSDDLCAIDTYSHETPLLYGSYPRLKLNEDVGKHLFPDQIKSLKIDDLFEKYIIDIRNQFTAQPIRIHKIYELNVEDKPHIQSKRLDGKETMEMLYRNIFRFRFSKTFGSSIELFKSISILANTQATGIYRSNDRLMIDELASYIEKDFL